MQQSVYLIAPEEELSGILSQALSAAGYEVVTFARGEQARQAIEQVPPDLAVMDVKLPDLDGLELLKRVRQRTDCAVLLVSSQAPEVERILGLELGADDYLLKPFSPRELVARARALFRRLERQQISGPGRASKILTYRSLQLDMDARILVRDGQKRALTWSEYAILSRLMSNPTRIYSRSELLEPTPDGRESRAVDMHVANLRKKVGELNPGFQPIRSVRGLGYRFAI